MPELPEAENICRALGRCLTGRRITKVEVFSPMMRTPLTPLLDADLLGHMFTSVHRRGRYVIAALDDNRGLLMHFGMSGVVRIEDLSVPKRKHEHVFIHLDNGKVFRFECVRRFSLLEVHNLQQDGNPACLQKLGIEPLTEDFTGMFLFEKSRKVKGATKTFLMNNDIVVGIGNIYANETLFTVGVDPRRPACSLTLQDCQSIAKEVKALLLRAIDAGGSTISDFLNVDGSEGKFARELRIYGKSGMPCPICGTIIEVCRIGGRSSFYCPKCQK